MRTSNDERIDGRLMDGFDYEHQAWVVDGCYVRCGHPATMDCKCYGKEHEGEETQSPTQLAQSHLESCDGCDVSVTDLLTK